jgi:hypothetical protein
MERDGQLDDAEARAEMAAGHGHGGDRLLPELVGELGELVLVQPSDVAGIVNAIEQGRVGPV